jgi:DNA polymerase
MTPAAPLDPRAAARSLLAWWEAAGVEVVAPVLERAPPARAAPAVRAAPGPARSPVRVPVREPARGPVRAATPAARSTGPAEEDARTIAARCASLDELKAALEAFGHPLRAAARSTVFARGDRDAAVMVVGEAPGREEDLEGLPFVGRSGQLMDRMFAEIGLTAASGLYITNVVNWRPRNNRSPSEEDIALCRPFIARHVALMGPKLLVFAGAVAAQTLLGTTQGITRLRGKWASFTPEGGESLPALPIYHPAYVLRRPIAKREVWKDLLNLEARLAALATKRSTK